MDNPRIEEITPLRGSHRLYVCWKGGKQEK